MLLQHAHRKNDFDRHPWGRFPPMANAALVVLFVLAFATRAAADAPSPAEAHRLRGNALAEVGKLDSAYQEYLVACSLGDARGCYNLGLAETRGEGVKASCAVGAASFLKGCQGGFGRACVALASIPEGCRRRAGFPTTREAWAAGCALGESTACAKAQATPAGKSGFKKGAEARRSSSSDWWKESASDRLRRAMAEDDEKARQRADAAERQRQNRAYDERRYEEQRQQRIYDQQRYEAQRYEAQRYEAQRQQQLYDQRRYDEQRYNEQRR